MTRDADDRRGLVRPDGHRRAPPAGWATCALVAAGTVAFDDPADTGPYELIGRHGSLTAAEMFVPLLAVRREPA